MNRIQLKARAHELSDEFDKAKAALDEGRLDAKRFNGIAKKILDESEEIRDSLKALDKADGVMAAQEAAMGGNVLPGEGVPFSPLSPVDIPESELKNLWQAIQHKTPYSVEIRQKKIGPLDGIGMKATVTESGIGGGFSGNLPPVQTPFAVGLGYEPVRIMSLFPGAQMAGPSATWLSHTANAAEVTGVGEAATKPDIGPTIVENQVKPQKIAGLTELTLEAWQDTGGYGEGNFSAWLPQELTRSLINTESLYVLQATTGASNPISGGPVNATFNGLLNTSGTLTRAVGTDTPLDALSKAYVDLRVGPAFADPDLVLMNPATWGALRRQKDANGRYILDLLSGPLNLTADGSPGVVRPAADTNPYSIIKQGEPGLSGDLWGAPVAISTQVPAGTAVVASVKAGAGVFWQRLGLRLEFNMWAQDMWTQNLFSFRAEERIAFSVPRPTAINVVTGLPVA